MEMAVVENKVVLEQAKAEKMLKQLASIRAQKTALANEEKKLMAEIKEMGVFDFFDYNKEQFVGETIIANKVPFLTGTRYDLEKVRKLLASLKLKRTDYIHKEYKYVVDDKAMQSLVDNDLVPQELIDSMAIRGNKLTVKIVG